MIQGAHVVVGGGSGFVGSHLVRLLRSKGAKVKIISRSASQPDRCTWEQIRTAGLPKDTSAVINLAGRNILDLYPWTSDFKRQVYESRIGTNRLLVEAIHRSATPIKSFVTISGAGYYRPSDTDKEYDETWTQEDEPKGSNKNYLMQLAHDWEQASQLDEHIAPDTRRVVIRAGVVLGPDGGIISRLRLPFKMGATNPLGSGQQWMPWIHVNDLAGMFKFALSNEHVTGVINGVAPEQARNIDFTRALANSFNRSVSFAAPAFMIKLCLGPDRAPILLEGQRVKSRAGLLGFRYQYANLQDSCDAAALNKS